MLLLYVSLFLLFNITYSQQNHARLQELEKLIEKVGLEWDLDNEPLASYTSLLEQMKIRREDL